MSYQLPEYLLQMNLNRPEINYLWYDPDPYLELDFKVAKRYLKKLNNVGLRGKIALCIGVHEWVLGRFVGLTKKPLPYLLAEAAWCANINVNYLRYFEFEPDEYVGPIDKALLCSCVRLREVLYVSNNVYDIDDVGSKDPVYYSYNVDEWQETLKVLIALTLHILPDASAFIEWLDKVSKRLITLYSLPEQGPFDNLFGQDDQKVLLGDYVPREVLDLTTVFDKQQTSTLLNQFLENVDKTNPLLHSIEELNEKISSPYVMT